MDRKWTSRRARSVVVCGQVADFEDREMQMSREHRDCSGCGIQPGGSAYLYVDMEWRLMHR